MAFINIYGGYLGRLSFLQVDALQSARLSVISHWANGAPWSSNLIHYVRPLVYLSGPRSDLGALEDK